MVDKESKCVACDNGPACMENPYGDTQKIVQCDRYWQQPQGEVLIFMEFPCGHTRKHKWTGDTSFIRGVTYNGYRPSAISVLSIRPPAKSEVATVIKLVTAALGVGGSLITRIGK